MSRVVIVGFAITSMGCAQLAGLDVTTGEGLPGNSVAVQRMSVGATVARAPLDLTGLAASYLVAGTSTTDYERVPASDGGGGAWTTSLHQPAPVMLTLPGDTRPLSRLYDFPTTNLSLVYAQLEHPNPAAPPDGAMLSVAAHLDAPAAMDERFEVYTVGAWTSHPLPVEMLGVTDIALTYAFDTSTSLSERPRLDRLTAQDAFLILRHNGPVLTGVAEATPFDQTGDDPPITATMAPVSLDRTLDVTITPDIARRYFAVQPAVNSLKMQWSIVAAPGAQSAINVGPVLNSGGLLPSELGVSAMYGNPFAGPPHGWSSLFALATYESRTYQPSESLSVVLYAVMNQFVEPTPGLILGLDAELPTNISINGQKLTSDGQTVPRPTGFVEVKFDADPKASTLFDIALYDLLPDTTGTQLEYHFVFQAEGLEPTFHLPPEIFEPGHTYTLRATCFAGGYPGIKDGDLTTRQLPMSQSFLDSGVFTVMP